MKDFGSTKKILGMKIQRDLCVGTLFLSQKSYIEKVLEKYNLSNCKAVATPLLHILNCHRDNVLLLKMRKCTCLTYHILMFLGISCML
jgi:hypothetical protein